MKERIDEIMKGCKNERMIRWKDERMKGRNDKRMKEWKNDRMED